MQHKFSRVAILGLGYIGLPTAATLASRGMLLKRSAGVLDTRWFRASSRKKNERDDENRSVQMSPHTIEAVDGAAVTEGETERPVMSAPSPRTAQNSSFKPS